MPYLIDGYNLAHALNLVPANLGPRGLENARRTLLDFLANHPDGQTVTVVFDARAAPKGTPTRLNHRGIEVLFGPSADDLIEELIEREKSPRQLIVVSGDNRLRDSARRRGCPVLACLDLVEKLAQPPPSGARVRSPQREEDKPQELSSQEIEKWVKEFEDLDDGSPPGWY